MKDIKIFLASSEELKRERLEFVEAIQDLRPTVRQQGVDITLEKWEYLDASISINHKQQDYNEILTKCDKCVILYWTKFGSYTKEEFDIAYEKQKLDKQNQNIFVCFKNTESISDDLKHFKDTFVSTYGFNYIEFDKFTDLWQTLSIRLFNKSRKITLSFSKQTV